MISLFSAGFPESVEFQKLTKQDRRKNTTCSTGGILEVRQKLEHKEEPIHLEQLTPEQRDAAKRAIQGENLFLTGAAGTGYLGLDV